MYNCFLVSCIIGHKQYRQTHVHPNNDNMSSFFSISIKQLQVFKPKDLNFGLFSLTELLQLRQILRTSGVSDSLSSFHRISAGLRSGL